ncbi:GGDEF domain-containing protein [Diaphorobacter nitroreducens]|uniref:GGDEF domain-containing protein n=1 Tax=Diaphorobacter nitroreducens TaxID=164759 RepID=UPI0035AEAB84
MTLFNPLARSLRAAAHDDAQVRDEVAVENLRRLRLGALLALPVFGGASLWMLQGALGGAAMGPWQRAVGMTHLSAMGLALLLGALAHVALHRAPTGRAGRALPVLAAVLMLLLGIALTAFYQWVTPKFTPLVLTAVGVALVFYLRPPVSTALFAVAAVAGFVTLPLTQPDPALLASGRVSVLVIPLMSLVFSVLSWRKNAVNILLSRSLAQANATLAAKQVELERLASHDGLTGLCNRGEFMRRADHELLRALRHKYSTAFILLDLDHFKRVNDHYGHPTGDAMLRHVSALLASGVRASDVVARLGGEEFVVLLPHTDLESALRCAEKLRLRVQAHPLATDAGPLSCTVSLGVVEVPPRSRADVAAAYAAIDRALYRAKSAGRNRVKAGTLDEDCGPTEPARLVA